MEETALSMYSNDVCPTPGVKSIDVPLDTTAASSAVPAEVLANLYILYKVGTAPVEGASHVKVTLAIFVLS